MTGSCTPTADNIQRAVLSDGPVTVAILNLGCITQRWDVPSRDGPVSVVLGYRDPAAYLSNPSYLGTIVGRVANRIGRAQFTLHNQHHQLAANHGPHLLHGGANGLSTRLWQMQRDGNRAVQLRLISPDGDQGFPGRAEFTVTIRLDGASLCYDMHARVDRPTPINLAQHNYYTLTGHGDIRDHHLKLAAHHYTANDPDTLPTGQIVPVANSRFDFTRPRRLSEADTIAEGYDHNFVLSPDLPPAQPAASVRAPNDMSLTLHTDQPGLQLYSGQHLSANHLPLPTQVHAPYHGLCLEAQGFPDAVNQPAFPSIIATPDQPYRQRLTVRIAQEQAR